MDSYQSQFAYAPSTDASAYMSLRYPGVGMTPMMGPVSIPVDSSPSFVPAPVPHYHPVPALSSLPAASPPILPAASQISSTPCLIYRHEDLGLVDQQCPQICLPDGRIFVEHVPGHSIIFVPITTPLDQVVIKPTKRPVKPLPKPTKEQVPRKQPKEKSAKPINAFIKYRSFKINELKEKFPDASQTEISRLAGESWKAESEEVKNQFRTKYNEEKKEYDMKKATSKRPREESVSTPLGLSEFERRRSSFSKDRAASASPLLVAKKPNKRRCVTDMRKQLAKSVMTPGELPPVGKPVRSQSMGLESMGYFNSHQGDQFLDMAPMVSLPISQSFSINDSLTIDTNGESLGTFDLYGPMPDDLSASVSADLISASINSFMSHESFDSNPLQ
ncbi:hypothetical protein BX070DRAFT_217990 [Coemansia spiralis]|nr:hypothetical protein BX070DRAFT_217990 [Coemansia spiralis]